MTLLSKVYDSFFSMITDDMYMELDEESTKQDCRALLNASLPLYEFPPEVLTITDKESIAQEDISYFDQVLTLEDINILATGMLIIWLQRQITSIEVVRQKYTGTDFKQTSQASHLQRLMTLLSNTKDEHRRLQMLASRRQIVGGKYQSTFYKLVH